jgi:hypothetical protein
MALNASGPISIGGATTGESINLELGRSATATSQMNESAMRSLAGVASGAISLSSFYGKSNRLGYGFAYMTSANLGVNRQDLIQKVTYSTNTFAASGISPGVSGFDAASEFGTSAIESMTVGLYYGGSVYNGGKTAELSGVNFSTQTQVNPGNPGSPGFLDSYGGAGSASSLTAGYMFGGRNNAGSGSPVNQIRKILFSTYAGTTLGAVLSGTASETASGYSATQGFVIQQVSYTTPIDRADAFTFSTETRASTTASGASGYINYASVQSKTIIYFWNKLSATPPSTLFARKFTISTATYATFTGGSTTITNGGYAGPTQPVPGSIKGLNDVNLGKSYFLGAPTTANILTHSTETVSTGNSTGLAYTNTSQLAGMNQNNHG